jgi:SAM-dependent methyltransferase
MGSCVERPASLRTDAFCDILDGEVISKVMSGYEKSAHLYDIFDDKDNVDFFLHYAAQAGEILDVGAGTGRIAIPLAEQGIRVVCVEPSEGMRRQLQDKLERRPHLRSRIRIVPGDAASFNLESTYPAACLSGTFDHFADRHERLVSLQNVVRHLEPGGLLLFDVFLGLMGSSPLSPAGRYQDKDREVRRFVGREVLPKQRVHVKLVFEIYQNGELVERVEEASLVGVTTRDEIHALLAQVGCHVRREFSDYSFAPYREGDDLLLVEAMCLS